jgi:hypothetical protein
MKNNWKAMAAGLAVVIGISGAAFGQNNWNHRNDNRPARVEQHNNVQRARDWHDDHRAPARTEGWYGEHRAPVYRGSIYRGPVYTTPRYRGPVYSTPYYGYSAPYYGYNGAYNGAYGYNSAYGYGAPGAYANGNAESIGFQDGLNDGRNDRITGHSFRPTHDDNYKNATRGYGGGGEQGYKDTYRVGYEQGYQQGYGR